MADKFNVSIVDAIRNAQKKKQQEADKKNKYAPVNRSAPQTAQESIQSGQGPVNYVKKSEKKQSPKTSTKQSVQTVQEDVYVEPESPFKPKIERASFQQVMADVMARGEERREQLREQASKQAHKKELKEDKAVRFQNARFVSGDYIEEKDKPKILPGKEQNAFKRRQQEKDKEFKDDVYAEQTQYIRTANQKREAYKADGKIIPESAALDDSGDKLKGFMVQDFYTDYNKRQSLKNESKEQFNNSVSMLGLNSDALSRQRFTSAKDMPKLDAYGYEYSIKQSAKKAGVTPEEYVRNEYRKQGYELKDDFKLSDLHLPKKVGDYILEGYDKETAIPFLNTDKDIIKGDSIKLLNSTKDVGLEYGGGKDIHMAQYMTESEMNYYMFFLGRDGEETARKYLNEIRYKLIDRATKQQQDEEYVKYGAENPVSSYAESLALSIETAGEGALNLMNSAIGRNATDATTRSGNAMNAISQGREDSAKTVIGKGLHFITGGLVENAPSRALNAVAPGAGEVLDFFMGVGQELGQHSRAGTLDNEAVMLDALVAGATEATEFKYIGKFTGKTLNKLAARTGMSGLKAATTSVITSMLNGMGAGFSKSLINSAADYMLMGEDSIYNRSLEMYKAYGFSQEAAEKKALNDAVISPTVSGLLVGGAMGTVYSLPGTVKYSVDFSNRGRQIRNSDIFKGSGYEGVVDSVTVETLLRYGMTFGKNTDAGRSAEALYKKYIRGEKISDSQLGAQDVLNRMEYARGEEYRQSITDLTKIEIKHDLADTDLEGMYDNGTIRLAEKPDSNQGETIRHELGHGLENTEGYKRYVELITEQDSYNKALASTKARYDERGIEYDDALVRSEVAAEFVRNVIPKTTEDMYRLKRAAENNPSLYDRMYNNIRDLRAKMKAKGGKVFTDKVTGLSVSYADLRKAERYLENALIEVSSTGYNEGSNMYRLRMRADQTKYGVNTAQAVNVYRQRYAIQMNRDYSNFHLQKLADDIRNMFDAYENNADITGMKNRIDAYFNSYKHKDDRSNEHSSLSDYVMQLYINARTSDSLRANSEQYRNDIKMFNAPVSSFVAGMFNEAGRDIKTEDFMRISDDLRSVYTILKSKGLTPELEEMTSGIVREIYKDSPMQPDIARKANDVIKYYEDSQLAAKETDADVRAGDESKYGIDIEGEFRKLNVTGLTEGEVKSLADVTRNIVDHIESTGMYTKGEFGKFIDESVAKVTYGRGRSLPERVRIITALKNQIENISTSVIGKKLYHANEELTQLQKNNKNDPDFDYRETELLNTIRSLKNQMANIGEWKKKTAGTYAMSKPGQKRRRAFRCFEEIQNILNERADELMYKVSHLDEVAEEAAKYVDTHLLDDVYDELINGTGEGREEWTVDSTARAIELAYRYAEVGENLLAANVYLTGQDRVTAGGQMTNAWQLFYSRSPFFMDGEKIKHDDRIIREIGNDEGLINRIETAENLDLQDEAEADTALKKENAEYKKESEEIEETQSELKDLSNKKTDLINEYEEKSSLADDIEKTLENSRKVQEKLKEKAEKKKAEAEKKRQEIAEKKKQDNEWRKRFASIIREVGNRNQEKVKQDVEAQLHLQSLGISEDDAYHMIVSKRKNPAYIERVIADHVNSVLDDDLRIKNPVKYAEAKKDHIKALSVLSYEGAEYRDMQRYNKNIFLYNTGKISAVELDNRNGKMFARPNDKPFNEDEMSAPKARRDEALRKAYEKEEVFNLARRQALAYANINGLKFKNATERYVAYDEAFDRGEFNYDGKDYSGYKPTAYKQYNPDDVINEPDILLPPAIGEEDSISHYVSQLSVHLSTLKEIRNRWKRIVEYADYHNRTIESEQIRNRMKQDSHNLFEITYELIEDISSTAKYERGIEMLDQRIKEVEVEYNKLKQEDDVLGWRQDVSDILSDEEIDALVKQYKLDESRNYTEEELFSIINRENALLNERLNNFVEGRENADNELVSVEQKMKVLRKTMRNLQKSTSDKRSAWLQLKRAGAGDDELKTHLDSVYEELGVDHIKSADWKYLRESAAMINDMESIDELIDLILEASKVRGTAKGTTVYKNLMRAFGGGLKDGNEAEVELYNANLERLKGIASQQLMNMVRETGEVSGAAKLKQMMYINHLNNFATASRNFLANPLFKPFEDFSINVPGLMLDKMFGMFTKTRGVSWVNPVSGFKPGVKRGLDSILETQLNVKILDDNAKNPEARIDADKSAEAHTYTRKFKKSFLSRFDSLVDKLFADSDNDKILRAKDEETYNKKRAKKDKVRDGVKSVLDFSPYAMAERSLGYIMGGGDEFAKGVSKHSLTKSLDKLVKDGFLTADEAKTIVGDEIKFRTFQDDNVISNTLVELQKAMNHIGFGKKDKNGVRDFGLGDLIITYAKIPGNIVARYLEYSSAGYLKSIYCFYDMAKDALESSNRKKNLLANPLSESDIDYAQSIKIFDAKKQRKAVLALARPLTGAGIFALGYVFKNSGIIVGSPQNDYDLEQYERAKKTNKYFLNLSQLGRIINGEYDSEPQKDDTLINIAWIAPFYGLLSAGAYTAEHMPEADDWGERFKVIFDANVFATVDQFNGLQMTSSIRGLYNNAKNYGMSTDFVAATINDWVTSVFIPQPVKQFANSVETRTYDLYKNATVKDLIKNKWEKAIPGNIGEDAPFRVDIWGNLEDNSIGSFWADLANNMLNPSKISKYKPNLLTSEFDRLLKLSKDILPRTPYRSYKYETNGTTYQWELNGHDYQKYAVLLGSTSYKAMTAFMMSDGYDYLPDSYRVQGYEDISKNTDKLIKEIWIGMKHGANPDKLQERINEFVTAQKETAMKILVENTAKEYIKRDGVNVEDVYETGYYVPYTEQEKADYIGERTDWIKSKQDNINKTNSGSWFKNKTAAERATMIGGWQSDIEKYQGQIDDMLSGDNKGKWKNITGSFNELSEEDMNTYLSKLSKDVENIKLPDEVFEDFESYMPKSNAVIDITDGVPFEERALPNGKMDGNKSALDFSFSTEEYDNSVKPDYKPSAIENKSEAVKELLNPDTRGFFERHKPEIKSDTEGEAVEEKEKTADDYLAMYTPKEESESGGSGGSKKYYKKYYKKYRKYYSKGKRYYKKSSRGPQLLSNYKGRQSRSGRFRPRFGGGSSGSSEGYSSGRFTPRFNVR